MTIRLTIASALIAFAALPLSAAPTQQTGVLGRWLSESGNGLIDIYPCADRLCGKIVWLQSPVEKGAPAVDEHNPDPTLRQRPLCGLVMLGDFRPIDANRWSEGWIYNPEDGRTYRGTMTLESDSVLKLRGYVIVSLLGKTETWTRPDPSFTSCR